ncbi:MAG: DUF2760 domain-containing protein [Planctomycetaceae bacterium]
MALGTAFRAFFAALFNRDVADQLREVLDHPEDRPGTGAAAALPAPVAAEPPKPTVLKPTVPTATAAKPRSDAITLLATLQREARLIDLVQENLSQYSDAQIGAAARPCLQQCAASLERMLGLKPIESAAEGQTVTVPETAPPARYLWIGEGTGAAGRLVHHGWEASHVDLPQWTGADADSRVIAPVQVKRL